MRGPLFFASLTRIRGYLMKSVLLAVFAIASTTSFASHMQMCTVEAKVVEIKNLARLDGVAIFRQGIEDYEQIATVEVLKVTDVNSRNGCIAVGTKVSLHVDDKKQGAYQEDQVLTFEYQNVGDAMGSRISWLVK